MSDPDPNQAKSLVSSVLGKLAQGPAETQDPPPEAPAPEEEVDPAALAEPLIDLYFELEDPNERDALLERLAGIKAPVVDEFFTAVLEDDEDDYTRAEAAAFLAKRGDPRGVEILEADLAEAAEPFLVENAIKTLTAIRGEGFYDPLVALWQDPQTPSDVREQAMWALESIAPERALADFQRRIESMTTVADVDDDELEAIILAFVRHEHAPAAAALQTLAQRLAQAPGDPEIIEDLIGTVEEGRRLLGP